MGFGKTETYQKKKLIGKGSYAMVYKGYTNLFDKVVALKEISLQEDEGAPFTAIREASLLKRLKHANIVTLHDIIHTKESLTFVFEYIQADLGQYMEKANGSINPFNCKLFLFQLFRGLEYCHAQKILHRDLKPQVKENYVLLFLNFLPSKLFRSEILLNYFDLHQIPTFKII